MSKHTEFGDKDVKLSRICMMAFYHKENFIKENMAPPKFT